MKADPDYVRIQQLVIIKTSALNRSAYCMSHNVPLGKKIGLTEEQIAAAQGTAYLTEPGAGRPPEGGDPLGRGGDQHDGRATTTRHSRRCKQHFTEKQIVELTVFCGMWNYSNRLCEALTCRPGAPRQAHRVPGEVNTIGYDG